MSERGSLSLRHYEVSRSPHRSNHSNCSSPHHSADQSLCNPTCVLSDSHPTTYDDHDFDLQDFGEEAPELQYASGQIDPHTSPEVSIPSGSQGMDPTTSPSQTRGLGEHLLGSVSKLSPSKLVNVVGNVINEGVIRPNMGDIPANLIGAALNHSLPSPSSTPHKGTTPNSNYMGTPTPAFGVTPGRTTSHSNTQNVIIRADLRTGYQDLMMHQLEEKHSELESARKRIEDLNLAFEELRKSNLDMIAKYDILNNYTTYIQQQNHEYKDKCNALQNEIIQQDSMSKVATPKSSTKPPPKDYTVADLIGVNLVKSISKKVAEALSPKTQKASPPKDTHTIELAPMSFTGTHTSSTIDHVSKPVQADLSFKNNPIEAVAHVRQPSGACTPRTYADGTVAPSAPPMISSSFASKTHALHHPMSQLSAVQSSQRIAHDFCKTNVQVTHTGIPVGLPHNTHVQLAHPTPPSSYPPPPSHTHHPHILPTSQPMPSLAPHPHLHPYAGHVAPLPDANQQYLATHVQYSPVPSSVLRGTPKSQGTTHSVTRGHKSMFKDKHSNKDASVKEEKHSSHKASPIKEDHSPKSHHSSKSIPKRESSRPQSSARPSKEHTPRSPPSSNKVDTSKYRKISSKQGGDPPSPSQSSSSSHTSSSSYRTSASYAPSITTTQSSYHSTSSTSTRHSRKSHGPDKFVQVMETVHELAHAIAQQGSKESSPPVEKFKMNNYFQLKHMRISKGERITTPFILKTLSTVKSIESAASKASNRKPQTTNEWDTYLKFHLSHLEDSLHEEMSSYCQEHEFYDSSSFWTQVYKKVFPAEVALDAFDKALTTYMIWTEPWALNVGSTSPPLC
jgi:hypothetical protein